MDNFGSGPTCKEFRSHHTCVYNKKLENMKINDFSWTHQRPEVTEQIATLKSRKTEICRETQLRSVNLEQISLDSLIGKIIYMVL